ncbi:hypothetical protein BDZ45DRAFT_657373 [Acephala macrosclerotiorum]|nr:hypothetical protein BDZ45DRAFT_657373 [Acephala macrosclerotiorum]
MQTTGTADTVEVRKEWRSLTDTEKAAYIDAELCLMALDGETGLPGAVGRFDDLQAVHQHWTNTTNGDIIHSGQFLPWHRWFVYTHATLLRTQCNYTGTIPWWDEALDAASGNFFQSNMWSDDTGFGGNGTAPDNCVTTGPFANRTMHIGPMEATTDYCFKRDWDNTLGVADASQENVDECYAYNDYASFWECLIALPHVAGHGGTGGVMVDGDCSPGDPIFFLHHNYLDRLWWQWQQSNSSSRMYDMAGYTTSEEPATGWVNTTLSYVMSMYDIIPNVTVEQVMNVQGGYLCYEFEY